jgi:dTDP-4-amino-4,6-dideoxygalactose transaminase
VGDDYFVAGINGKNSEFHAAMGLANLPYLSTIIGHRKQASEYYDQLLAPLQLQRPQALAGTDYNFAYYPVIFSDEARLLKVMAALKEQAIVPRRYFYPSLNRLPYVQDGAACSVSESTAEKALCLPLSDSISRDEIENICKIIAGCF